MSNWFSQSSLTWLLGLAVGVAIAVILVFTRRHQRSSQAREHAEALAQRAEADHEGARTRHEGGA